VVSDSHFIMVLNLVQWLLTGSV